MPVKFLAMPTQDARHYQNGGRDAYGNAPVTATSDGGAIPCRHCLKPVAAGLDYLILAYRPFDRDQPYAETGPVFLHRQECARAGETPVPAPMHARSGRNYILRGYRDNDWINYEVAEVVPAERIAETAERMLSRNDVAYLHMRSAEYNCYQCRIERA
jgi:hypothetical protein